ncbi:hypothetical protein C7M84_003964 [Penaeus vannamei]|uniref:G-protein coupled receptors family 1 profile domain-containing protein n=1 Tax=Penaeus vannamei TaxID=6689 RepID=A0A423TLT2_PENVA|nr:hypothetical protein C7M84_003964 [Penaeus vannamei]
MMGGSCFFSFPLFLSFAYTPTSPKCNSPGQVFSCGTAVSSSLTSVFAVYYLCCMYGLVDDHDTEKSLFLCLARLCGAAFCISAALRHPSHGRRNLTRLWLSPSRLQRHHLHPVRRLRRPLRGHHVPLPVRGPRLQEDRPPPPLRHVPLPRRLLRASPSSSPPTCSRRRRATTAGSSGADTTRRCCWGTSGCRWSITVHRLLSLFTSLSLSPRSQFRTGNPPGERSRVWEEFGLTMRTSLTFFTFLGCWTPFTLYKFISLVTASPVVAVSQVVGVLPFFTCALNPILLGLKVSQLRTESVDGVLLEGEREVETLEHMPVHEVPPRVRSSLGFETRCAKVSVLEAAAHTSSMKRAHSSPSCIVLSPAVLESSNESGERNELARPTASSPRSSSSPKPGGSI